MKNTDKLLTKLSKKYNRKIFFDYEYCEEDQASCAGTDIHLGKFTNKDKKIAAFFHELGHTLCTLKYEKHMVKMHYEIDAWRVGFLEMEKCGIPVTFEMIQYCLSDDTLSSYINHELRESTWDGCTSLIEECKKGHACYLDKPGSNSKYILNKKYDKSQGHYTVRDRLKFKQLKMGHLAHF